MAIFWEWLDLGVRWLHMIAGIAWIGSSFYFVHLDASIKRANNLPEGAGGEAWQVHSGGFYHMVKFLVAPKQMPAELTWFKWEAYATWLSGIALLIIVYYFSAELYLIDRNVYDLNQTQAILTSLGGLALGWIVYDQLCKGFGNKDMLLGVIGFCFLIILAWLFTQIFSARGAYMQMGALIGTIMVANVLLIVIPNQKIVVADLIAGRAPDPNLGAQAKQRSMHNNYLTLPVLFLMISNHYPLAYASRWSWVILGLILLIGGLIRHFYNVRHKGGESPWWTWFVSAALLIVVLWISSLPPTADTKAASAAKPAEPVKFAAVAEIVAARCSMCHAAEPVWDGIRVAPKGVLLDNPHQIRLRAKDINISTVRTHAMPPANITLMEQGEREILAAWIAQGAPGNRE